MSVLKSLSRFAGNAVNVAKGIATYPFKYMKEEGIKDGMVNILKRYGAAGMLAGAVGMGIAALGLAYPAAAAYAALAATGAATGAYWATLASDLYRKAENVYRNKLSPGKSAINTMASILAGPLVFAGAASLGAVMAGALGLPVVAKGLYGTAVPAYM